MSSPPIITAAVLDYRLAIDDETVVRPLRASDTAAVYECIMRNTEHLREWMTWIDGLNGPSDVAAWLRSAEREAYEHSAFKAAIWRRSALAGFIDLHDIDWKNGSASIGYWLDRTFTGQGLMTQAVQLLTEYAFEALNLHRLEIHVATENHASRRIPERLGFKLEGVLRGAQRLRGTYVDHALYATIRDDAP